MKVLVQWTKASPEDYVELDSSEWAALPRKPLPRGGEAIDDALGWAFDLLIQGISFAGTDHYHVEDLGDRSGGIRVTCWRDDPEDQPPDEFWAEVWTILPLAPDPRIGGALNTRQSKVIYAAPAAYERWTAYPKQNTVIRPWSEFVPPPAGEVRHGIWVPDEDVPRYERYAVDPSHGWRAWTEGLDASELDRHGRVRGQRPQGRFRKAKGTKTFFLYDEALASGVHAATNELRQEVTDLNLPVDVDGATNPGGAVQTHMWTTDSDEPNVTDWPSGNYRCQIDVSQVMRIDSFGFLTLAGVAGHIVGRVDSGLTADLGTQFEQTEPAFTTTGILLATTGTIDPAAGAIGDRFECVLVADATSESMAGNLRISCDNGDSFSDGPWTVAGPQTLTPAPVVASFVVPAPTVQIGGVTLQPAPASAAWGVPAPTVQIGGLTLQPAPVTAAWGVPAPTVVIGAVTLSPAPTVANFVVPAPTVQIGGVTLQPAAVVANWVVPAVTIFSGQTLSPAPVVASFVVPAVTVVPGPLTISPTPVVAAWGVPPQTISPGPLTLSPGAASATWTVPAPTLLPTNTLTPGPVVASFVVPAPTVIPGPFTITPAAVQAAWGVPAPTLVIGGLTLTPGAATATWVVPAATITAGVPLTEYGGSAFDEPDVGGSLFDEPDVGGSSFSERTQEG